MCSSQGKWNAVSKITQLCSVHSRGKFWLVQARLRLTRVQKEQLAEQGTENATVLTMRQGQSAGIASMLQVCK